MIVGKASLSDVEAIAGIQRAARQKAMPWLPLLHTPEEDLWFFKALVVPKETVLVARIGIQTAGFISINEGWLNHLYVAPEHWGKGVGARLLDTGRSDLSGLQLWVFQKNVKARRFYMDRGFLDCEVTDGQRNGEKLPDVRMIWLRGN